MPEPSTCSGRTPNRNRLRKMGLFSKLFGGIPDPTADWQVVTDPLPVIRLQPFALGELRFGDKLDAARFLGRPDQCDLSKTPGMFTLVYTSRGFELAFDDFRLSEAEFYLGYGTFFSPEPDEAICTLRLANGTVLNDTTTREDIEQLMGKPTKTKVDPEDGDEDWSYHQRDVAMRFKFTPQGTLAVWSLYGE
jgi:hypothetical protein